MLFNSLEYFIFFPLIFVLYWSLKRYVGIQNLLILVASYFFYAYWDYRFLSLIIISSFVDFIIGLKLDSTENLFRRKLLVGVSLFVNLGFLFVFKYYNFFVESFSDLLMSFGLSPSWTTLNIIIPVGISFYTFQTLSYTIDIYKSRLKPTSDIIAFFAYVSFFPQLVAGPIERAANLLPQFGKGREFKYEQGKDGLRQILWGMFKKVVIADNCAVFVDAIYANYTDLSGGILLLGGILFVILIYADFSGYTDIAIGSAKLLGFSLMQNFDNPYFSLNTTTFWRKWHISMSSWFRDYVFNPLLIYFRGLRKTSTYITTFITFVLIGIWHGANWTFIMFGIIQGIALSVEIYSRKFRKRLKKKYKGKLGIYNLFSWLLTMSFWLLLCIIFRSETFGDSIAYIQNIFYKSELSIVENLRKLRLDITLLLKIFIFCVFLFSIEWFNRQCEHGFQRLPKIYALRYVTYLVLYFLVIDYLYGERSFVYFQF